MNFLIIVAAKYLLYALIAAAVVILFLAPREKAKRLLLLAVISFPLAFVIAKILSHFINDPRPFMVEHIQPLISHAAGNGFPSDHTLLGMAIASVLFTYNKKMGVVFGILALIVGFARVLAHVHHTIDILGSSLIAIVATYIAWEIVKRIKWPARVHQQ